MYGGLNGGLRSSSESKKCRERSPMDLVWRNRLQDQLECFSQSQSQCIPDKRSSWRSPTVPSRVVRNLARNPSRAGSASNAGGVAHLANGRATLTRWDHENSVVVRLDTRKTTCDFRFEARKGPASPAEESVGIVLCPRSPRSFCSIFAHAKGVCSTT